MGKLRLQPREFRLRAGARSEVDRRFLQIVSRLPEDTNLSEYIKTAVVQYNEYQSSLSEADRLQREFDDLLERIGDFMADFQKARAKNEEPLKLAELVSAIQELTHTMEIQL